MYAPGEEQPKKALRIHTIFSVIFSLYLCLEIRQTNLHILASYLQTLFIYFQFFSIFYFFLSRKNAKKGKHRPIRTITLIRNEVPISAIQKLVYLILLIIFVISVSFYLLKLLSETQKGNHCPFHARFSCFCRTFP